MIAQKLLTQIANLYFCSKSRWPNVECVYHIYFVNIQHIKHFIFLNVYFIFFVCNRWKHEHTYLTPLWILAIFDQDFWTSRWYDTLNKQYIPFPISFLCLMVTYYHAFIKWDISKWNMKIWQGLSISVLWIIETALIFAFNQFW